MANYIVNNSTTGVLSNLPPQTPNRLLYAAAAARRIWTTAPSMSAPRRDIAVATVSATIYAFGGYNGGSDLATVEAYKPNFTGWIPKASIPSTRYAGNGAAVIGTRVYLAGGFNLPTWPTPTNTMYIYDTGTDSWTLGANMPGPSACGASASIGGRVYVVTGCTSSAVYAAQLQRYDPALNSWTTLAAPPVVKAYPAMVAIGGRLYLVGGDISGTGPSRELDVYNPSNNTWTRLADMPTARYGSAATVAGGRLVVLGGLNAAGQAMSAVEYFDPTTGVWTSAPALPGARGQFGAATLGALVFGIGGSDNGTHLQSVVYALVN